MQVLVYPRPRRCVSPVVITVEVLEGLYHVVRSVAASRLGISETALKSACRKLGIQRWPCRRRWKSSWKPAPNVVDVDSFFNEDVW